MASCCGNTCACKLIAIAGGSGRTTIRVTGTGSSQDPFALAGPDIAVSDTASIDFTLDYTPETDTFTLHADFAASSQLSQIGDVSTAPPTAGYVLGWDATANQWKPVAPTTASAGSVTTDGQSILGDGAAGAGHQLLVQLVTDGGLVTTANGLKLSDAALRNMVLHFTDDSARAASGITFTDNQLSMLDTDPGVVFFYTAAGGGWQVANLMGELAGAELMTSSGPYFSATQPGQVTVYTANINDTTDANGYVTLTGALLSTYSGVLSGWFTPLSGYPVLVTLDPAADPTQLQARIYRFNAGSGDFAPAANYPIKGSFGCILY